MSETVEAIEQMIAADKKSYVVAINVDVVMKIEADPYLKKIVDDADMVLVDGKPLVWISKLHGRPLKEKVSGSDLVPLRGGGKKRLQGVHHRRERGKRGASEATPGRKTAGYQDCGDIRPSLRI